MDDLVKAALAKWPNVPHCYGWLALDARGNWRLRDEHAQANNLRGDVLTNPALLAFINRNYLSDQHDHQGNWYFQNGPQRVYVTYETTPYVAYSSPQYGLVLHTGQPLTALDSVSMTSDGNFIFVSQSITAQLDDRDLACMLTCLEIDGEPVSDEALIAYLASPMSSPDLRLQLPVLGCFPLQPK